MTIKFEVLASIMESILDDVLYEYHHAQPKQLTKSEQLKLEQQRAENEFLNSIYTNQK